MQFPISSIVDHTYFVVGLVVWISMLSAVCCLLLCSARATCGASPDPHHIPSLRLTLVGPPPSCISLTATHTSSSTAAIIAFTTRHHLLILLVAVIVAPFLRLPTRLSSVLGHRINSYSYPRYLTTSTMAPAHLHSYPSIRCCRPRAHHQDLSRRPGLGRRLRSSY
jgi:hypothetical protein